MSPWYVRAAFCALAALPLVAIPACKWVSKADPTPDNELPFGYVDVPRNGEVVGRTVETSGWALDDAPGVRVRVYVDRRFNAAAEITVPRPDVSKAFPQYSRPGDMHGWKVSVDLGPAEAPRTITVQAVDAEGATHDLGTVVVTVASR